MASSLFIFDFLFLWLAVCEDSQPFLFVFNNTIYIMYARIIRLNQHICKFNSTFFNEEMNEGRDTVQLFELIALYPTHFLIRKNIPQNFLIVFR